MSKTGIIDTGGGLRGAFGAGVLDWCNKNDVIFDCCIGVSAGGGNLVSYMAGQSGRNLRFYVEHSQDPEYMGVKNLLRTRSYLSMDYIYEGLTNEDGADPLNYDAFFAHPASFTVVATDANSGLPVYFDKSDFARNDYFPLKASSNIPVICRPFEHEGHIYFDGGLSDPIPLARAFAVDCEKVVVILSRPRDFVRTAGRDRPFARLLHRSYPRAANALSHRWRTYNLQMQDLLTAEKESRALILAPDSIDGIRTLTRDPDTLQRLYWRGYVAGEAIADFLDL